MVDMCYNKNREETGQERSFIMNKVILMGRLTREPDVRYSSGETQTAVARFTLAVDRRFVRRDGGTDQQTADFIGCVAFGRTAEFAQKYLHQGTKVVLTGRIQTGSYTNRDGQKVYTTDVVAEDLEFAESKAASEGHAASAGAQQGSSQATAGNRTAQAAPAPGPEGFMNIPDGLDEELPFV